MAANLSKVIGMGSCINGHINQDENTMLDSQAGGEKVAILDAGAQYGKASYIAVFLYPWLHVA